MSLYAPPLLRVLSVQGAGSTPGGGVHVEWAPVLQAWHYELDAGGQTYTTRRTYYDLPATATGEIKVRACAGGEDSEWRSAWIPAAAAPAAPPPPPGGGSDSDGGSSNDGST